MSYDSVADAYDYGARPYIVVLRAECDMEVEVWAASRTEARSRALESNYEPFSEWEPREYSETVVDKRKRVRAIRSRERQS